MKLLIFSASTGGGHKRAAAALEDTIHRLNPEVEVTVVDGLRAIGKMYDTTSMAFINDIKRLYPDIFEKHVENEKTVITGIASVLRQAQDENLVIKRINPEIAAYLFSQSMRQLHENPNGAKYGFKEEDIFDHLFISFLRGVATIKGIEMIEYLEKNQPVNQ